MASFLSGGSPIFLRKYFRPLELFPHYAQAITYSLTNFQGTFWLSTGQLLPTDKWLGAEYTKKYLFRSGEAPVTRRAWDYAIILVVAGMLNACSPRMITFTSNDKATVSLVTSSSTDGQGEVIGETPQSIPAEKIRGKVVKIWSADVYPQFWILDPLQSGETTVALKLEKKPESQNKSTASTNLKFRVMMKAYKALADQNWKLARELADELNRLEPETAAPHLIAGIALLREGKKLDARTSFEKAKTFDPEDAEIGKLIRFAQ